MVGLSDFPPAYLNGFPKCGLHMLEQACSAFVEPVAKNNWYGTNAWEDHPVERRVAVMVRKMWAVYPGSYAKGHMGYAPAFPQLLYSMGVVVIFIYRDLRDVAVSTAHHVLKASPERDGSNLHHPKPELYQALPNFESVLIAVLEGLGEFPGLFDRWASYAGWLDQDWVLSVKYEDLRRRERATCKRIADHYLSYSQDTFHNYNHVIKAMVERIRQRDKSITYRKGGGKSGGWQVAFTPKVKDCFKALDPGWLGRLGYAKDNDW